MTIGFLLDDSLDRPDGVQQYVLTLGAWLSNKGHTVHYLVGQTERTDIANIHSMARIKRVKFNGNVLGTPLSASAKRIKEVLTVLKLDVLHVQLPYSPLLAGKVIAACSPEVAIVGTLHIFPNSYLEHGMNKLLTMVNKRTLRRFDEIVAVSQVAANASHLPSRNSIQVIPNPVAIDRFRPSKQKTKGYTSIAFLGRLVERKGCRLLLEALAQMKQDGELPADVQVRIGGDGHLRSQLQAYAKQEGLDDIVQFIGFVDEADKPRFLQAADIAVYPSSGGESFGIVLIEAMAAGAVTLGGSNPGYAGVLGADSPALFTTDSPVALQKLLGRLIGDRTFRNKLRASQQELVRQFDIEHVGTAISEVYAKALHRRHNMT